MYSFFLVCHSWVRWLVVLTMPLSLFVAYSGWKSKESYTQKAENLRKGTSNIAHIQMSIGLCLYFLSPLVSYFRTHFKEAVHIREFRFFGMEHITVMLFAILMLNIGNAKINKQKTDIGKYKTWFIWYLVVFLLILSSVPWAFSPLTSRPWIRFF